MKKNINEWKPMTTFLSYLAIVIIARAIIGYAYSAEMNAGWIHIIDFFLYLSPAFAAWAAEKGNFSKFCSHNKLTFKNISWKASISYVAATACLFPLLAMLLIYVGGNLLNVETIGHISIPSHNDFSYMGIPIVDNSYLRIVQLWGIITGYALIVGSTLGALSVIAEEIGWRGFMENHLRCSNIFKPVLIGLVWTLWGIPFWIFGNGQDCFSILWKVSSLLLYNIVLSFYLSKVQRNTNSLWTSAMVRGVLTFCTLSAIYVPADENGSLCVSL
ncbi:CPBP family glutamic-type intramembrane protease [Bacteroides sp. GD17]|jgi:uncharacterized membrane protein|uniref:CPBP family glutamic-type intramembrane protease n=1 Tax=Bacteroides sp. GD17 TaxID=3139826 RepID=UPI0025FBF166|nr:CPBP family glutamic-type intramembrane protease [uncultured Bacteroides sp.]